MKILIADDHSIVRDGLRIALDGLGIDITAIDADCADAVLDALTIHNDTELVILDLHMPGSNGLDLLSRLCDTWPGIPVVVLSAEEDPQIMQQSIDRGAAGFIPKNSASNVLVSALQLVLSGGVYIPAAMLREQAPADGAPPTPVLPGIQPDFTQRQIDVLELLAGGYSNKMIARQLGLSEHTIKIHITAILRTLGVSNRTEAAIACRELGLVLDE